MKTRWIHSTIVKSLIGAGMLIGAIASHAAAESRNTEVMRHRYAQLFTGGEDLDRNDPDVKIWIQSCDAETRELWNSMDRERKATFLWRELRGFIGENEAYRRLAVMANAYKAPGSEFHKNPKLLKDIVYGLEFLLAKHYGHKEEPGNWWQYQIGIPNELGKCLTILWDDLSPTLRQDYLAALKLHQHINFERWFKSPVQQVKGINIPADPNIMWLLYRAFIEAMLAGDDAFLEKLCPSVEKNWLNYSDLAGISAFDPEKDGSHPVIGGWYPDGSYIAHGAHPYIGGYGVYGVDALIKLVYLAEGTKYAFKPEGKRQLLKFVNDTCLPFMYKSAIMDMVQGRCHTFGAYSGHVVGHLICRRLFMLSEVVEPEQSKALKQLVKHWGETDTCGSFLRDLGPLWGMANCDLYPIVPMKKLLQDPAIEAAAEMTGHYRFPIMDRVVHRRPGFAFAIAMYDDARIANAETSHSQNSHGWHMGDGMTYLYNSDVSQFTKDYWPTVDPHRLAGITVKRGFVIPCSFNGSKWVGGVDLDRMYGIAGMQLAPGKRGVSHGKYELLPGNTLTAKKSWFMFDDEIVALGCDISAADGAVVETIVENRRLAHLDKTVLTVNGQKLAFTKETQPLSGVNWMHLNVGIGGAETGYYFPVTANLRTLQERRTGKWSDVNQLCMVNTPCDENFVAFWFDHGVDPKQASYAYVLLPGKSIADVKAYAEHPKIEIVENSSEAQAVRHPALHITGVNFWNDAVKKVSFITVDRKASVMVRESNGRIDVAVSDPTQVNKGEIQIELDRAADKVISSDAVVEVKQLQPTIKLSVKVAGLWGATSRISMGATVSTRP